MKKYFFYAVFTAIVSLFVCSCDNTDDISYDEPSLATYDKSAPTLKKSTSKYGKLLVNPPKALLGTNFKFVVWVQGYSPQTKQAELRFEAPSGEIKWVDVPYDGFDADIAFFELNRTLKQCGEYRVSAYEKLSYPPYRNNLQCSESVIVLHRDIPFGDNYSNLNIGGMAPRNCTAWVVGKVNEMWGGGSFESHLGNPPRHAKFWKDRLVSKGYKADNNPRVGDVAWWKANVQGCSTENGHVAFVNKVSEDGNTVYITEYNFPSGNYYGTRTLKRFGASKQSEKFPTAFIHVQTKRN